MTDTAIALELRRLAAAVAELAGENRHLQRRLLAADDRRVGCMLVPLLPELAAPGAMVTTADIAARALNTHSPAGQVVSEIIASYTTEDGGLRSFGQLLARLEGVTFEGVRLEAAGMRGGVARWRLRVA